MAGAAWCRECAGGVPVGRPAHRLDNGWIGAGKAVLEAWKIAVFIAYKAESHTRRSARAMKNPH